MIAPIVTPVNVKDYGFKQSKHEVAPRLPFSQIIRGPSGSGKGILLQSVILDTYRDVYMCGRHPFQLTPNVRANEFIETLSKRRIRQYHNIKSSYLEN